MIKVKNYGNLVVIYYIFVQKAMIIPITTMIIISYTNMIATIMGSLRSPMVVMTYLVVRPDISASEARLPRVSALFIFIKEGAWGNHGFPTREGVRGNRRFPLEGAWGNRRFPTLLYFRPWLNRSGIEKFRELLVVSLCIESE